MLLPIAYLQMREFSQGWASSGCATLSTKRLDVPPCRRKDWMGSAHNTCEFHKAGPVLSVEEKLGCRLIGAKISLCCFSMHLYVSYDVDPADSVDNEINNNRQ